MTLSLSKVRMVAASALVLAGSLLPSALPTAQAKDLSLPYRNYPGFTCHHWNAKGECTDWSYFDYGTPAPAPAPYYAPPTYYPPTTSVSSYSSCLTRYTRSYCDDVYNRSSGSTSYTNCLRNYSRSYCDDRYDNDDDDDITVRVSASDSTVEEDDLLTYSIYIRNDDDDSHDVDVTAFLDTDTSYYSASDSDRRINSDEVEWNNLRVGRRSSKTLSLTVRVDDARDGDTVRLRVEADDEEDDVTVRVDDDDDDDDDDDYEDCLDDHSRSYCDDRYDNDDDFDSYSECRRSYSARYCDDYFDDDDDDDADVAIRVHASDTTPEENQLVTFTIVLDNNDDRIHTVDVTAILDPDLNFYSASDSGDENDDEVEWDNISVNAEGSRTLTVSARVDTSTRSGDELTVEVETDDESDEVTVEVD